jgi:L-ascorbate metabolism protein UlaG (beta-lactamase superfamily)
MNITWLGHAGFRIEIAGQVLLIDPWLRGNPSFDEARFDEAVAGATAVLLTHGHFDHAANVAEICKATGARLYGIYDMVTWLAGNEGIEAVGFNMGGTVAIGDVKVTMVRALHSSSATVDGKPAYMGTEAGFVIAGEGRTIYLAGDTDVHADMQIIADLHAPDIGILPVGGHFTMDQRRAAYACRKFFAFKAVIPCHYKTFPLLAQDAAELAAAIAPTPVHELTVMAPKAF